MKITASKTNENENYSTNEKTKTKHLAKPYSNILCQPDVTQQCERK